MLGVDDKFIEERTFFYKIVGDYYRYAAEATQIANDPEHQTKNNDFKEGALSAYQKCSNIARRGLKAYNVVRLGLALNFSVFQFEIMKD